MDAQYGWTITMGTALVAIGLCAGVYKFGARRMRDPRLDRDYSDDEPAPYDTPASLNPSLDSYERLLEDEHRRPPQL